MGERTGISWTHHTYNPWWGCTKVSPGCDHCYAETFDRRVGGSHWGPHAERRRIGEKTRALPLKWNRAAEAAGERRRVFCASMADVFDNVVPPEWRVELWDMIRQTPALDWLLLTKRPQNIAKMLPPDWSAGWPHVWLGTTVENQEEADRRIPHLERVPAAVRFLSCEPLLGPVELHHSGSHWTTSGPLHLWRTDLPGNDGWREQHGVKGQHTIHWVICGGESGGGARHMHWDWANSLRDQCAAAQVPFFMKQIGSRHDGWGTVTGKGDDPDEWPPHFRVQEFPR